MQKYIKKECFKCQGFGTETDNSPCFYCDGKGTVLVDIVEKEQQIQ